MAIPLRTSPMTRSSRLTPNISHSMSSLSISGYAFSLSHLLTDCRDTPISIASCSCVILCDPRRYCRLSLKPMVLSFSFAPTRFGNRRGCRCPYYARNAESAPPTCGCICSDNRRSDVNLRLHCWNSNDCSRLSSSCPHLVIWNVAQYVCEHACEPTRQRYALFYLLYTVIYRAWTHCILAFERRGDAASDQYHVDDANL